MPASSAHDQALTAELARRRKAFVARPEDDSWLKKISPRPDLLLAQGKKRGSFLHLGGGRYVPHASGAARASDHFPLPLLVTARLYPQPCAVAYRSALVHHALVDAKEAAGRPLTVAVRGLEGVRLSALDGHKVRLVRVDHARFLGHEEVAWQDAGELGLAGDYLVTDRERTLVDCLDKPRLCGEPETIAQAFRRAFAHGASGERVARYAQDLGHSQARRAAFWLEQVGQEPWARALMTAERLHEEELRDRHRLPSRSSRGRPRAESRPLLHPVLLDSTDVYQLKGPIDSRFGLVVNLPKRVIQLAKAN